MLVGLIWQPWEDTTLKLLYRPAFRAPDDDEMHDHASDTHVGNASLRPETIDTRELSWKQGIGQRHRVRVSGCICRTDGLITQVSDGISNLFDAAGGHPAYRS